ncbi:MAG: GNAT family N-acetyltransferase [Trueperaceae bacterium]|nr:GNAT family N-acetyltransferase [Trueperaceae bacterium]
MRIMTSRETLSLRPFAEQDHAPFTQLYNLIHPDTPMSEEEIRHFYQTRQSDIYVNEVLEDADKLIAKLFAMQADDGESRVRIDLYLHPDKVSEALREKLYHYLVDKLVLAESLVTRVREDWSELHSFFLAQKFVELERAWVSRLDLSTFQTEPFLWAFEKAKAAGISFKTQAALPSNDATHRMLYKTITEDFLPAVPTAEPLNIWPYEVWLERYLGRPERNPESVFLAFNEDELVGMSELYRSQEITKLKTGLSAVKETYRRKGIAMSLKLLGIQYALEQQAEEIATTNHSVNRPMLSINEALGFVKDPAWIRLKKDLLT